MTSVGLGKSLTMMKPATASAIIAEPNTVMTCLKLFLLRILVGLVSAMQH